MHFIKKNPTTAAVSLLIVLMAVLLTSCGRETGTKNFEMAIINGDEIEITKYIGDEKSVSIPSEVDGKAVTSIGKNAFWGCDEVTSIKIPEGVTNIGTSAFFNCMKLKQITFPSTVMSIGESIFVKCSSLEAIEVTAPNMAYYSVDGVLFDRHMTEIISYPAKKSGDYVIPDSVLNIHKNCFIGCTLLTKITIPDSVIEIGTNAFKGCSGLTEMILPEGVTSIRAGAFWECSSIASIKIPQSVTSIGEDIFYGCAKLNYIYVKEGSYADTWCTDNSYTNARTYY
jgi:hypothetical protein